MMKYFLLSVFLLLGMTNVVVAQDRISMRKEANGLYTIPCEVNGLKLRFIFDTGASAVSISLTEASFMLKNGYLDNADIIGTTNVQTADGNIAENYIVNLKELKIGSVRLNNIKATVSKGLDAPLLLGQTVLDKLGAWSINDSELILNDFVSDNDSEDKSFEQLEWMIQNGEKKRAITLLRSLVQRNDDYASYLFLSNVAEPEEASKSLLNDSDIRKAMEVLEEVEPNDTTNIYWNYEKLIWFSLYRLHDKEKAFAYFRKVESKEVLPLKLRDKLAHELILANAYGLNRNIEDSIAIEFFSKAYYEAYTTYASYLKDVKKNSIKAFQAFKKCSDKGYIPAMTELGLCYIDAIGTTRNITKGIELLNKAAHKGNILALSELCSRYYYGDAVKQDFDKVIEYANMFGHENQCDILNKAFTGIAYFGKKEYRMALQYLNEINLIWDKRPSNNVLAAFNQGVNHINKEILYAVGQAYEKGLGCQLDFDKAFKYYMQLAKEDPAWGYGMLGDMFFLNELIESDEERAYSYYILGANNNSGYCCYRVALMNYYGVGTYKNETKAKEYKSKAIKYGIPASDFEF